MARPKNETTATTTNSSAKPATVKNTVADENAILKERLAQQDNQIAQLMAQMQTLMQMQMGNVSAQTQQPKKNKMIDFINLAYGTLVLKGSGNKIWTIDGQFTKRSFTEYEAAAIVNNMSKLISSGAVYINDDEFIEEYHLADVFNSILSDAVLKSILDQDAKTVVKLYDEASDMQKKIILDMVMNRLDNGQEVDANILQKLGKASGKDLLAMVTPEEE